MPNFLPNFSDVFSKQKANIERKLNHSLDEDLRKHYSKGLEKYWHALPPAEEFHNIKLCAVDGSCQQRDLANGAYLYVTRALGITNYGAEFRDVQLNVIESYGIDSDEFSNFLKYKMEYSEMQVIKQFLDSIPANDAETQWVCFLDGSWYGRMEHRIWEFETDEEQGIMIDYHELLLQIFQVAKEKKAWLLGVSKGSSLQVLKNIVLQDIGQNIIRTGGFTQSEQQQLLQVFQDKNPLLLGMQRKISAYVKSLETKYKGKANLIKEVIWERAFRRRSDNSLIMQCIEEPGFSTPLELGPSPKLFSKYFDRLQPKDVDDTIHKSFKKYLSLFDAGNQTFINRAVHVAKETTKYPSIITFNMFLGLNDLPIRMDFPVWMLGRDNLFLDVKDPILLSDAPTLQFITNLVKLFMNYYGGMQIYHVFLFRVDEKVKLSNQVMNEIYEKYIEKQLNRKLIHTRDYRRVVGI